MIATDALSLIFLACFVFSGAFLVLSTALGLGHGHALHLGGHASAHLGHVGHGVHTGGHAGNTPDSAAHAVNADATSTPMASLRMLLSDGLNLYSILTLLLIFGLLGYLLHNFTHFGDVATLLVALIVGTGGALVIGGFISRILGAGGGVELTTDNSRMEGRLGTVSMAIRASGVGEVIFTGSGGARQSAGARGFNGAPIEVGTEVVILSAQNGIVTVQPWDEFMVSARAGTPPQLESIE